MSDISRAEFVRRAEQYVDKQLATIAKGSSRIAISSSKREQLVAAALKMIDPLAMRGKLRT